MLQVHWQYGVYTVCVCCLRFLQIKTRAVSAKQLTMVNAVDLLLFGSSSVISQNGTITMDDWCVLCSWKN